MALKVENLKIDFGVYVPHTDTIRTVITMRYKLNDVTQENYCTIQEPFTIELLIGTLANLFAQVGKEL